MENTKEDFQRSLIVMDQEKSFLKNELSLSEKELQRKDQLILQLMGEKESLERVLERERQIQLELRNEMIRMEEGRGARAEGGMMSDLKRTVKFKIN